MRPLLKILHTADLHLGAKFVKLGAKGVLQRRRLCEVLTDIVDLGIREQVDLALFVGDTFDNQYPSYESISAFEFAVKRLNETGIPALLIAGTHDYLCESGILRRYAGQDSPNPILLSPQRPFWESKAKHVIVHGVSLEAADSPLKPLTRLRRSEEPCWQIGMAHASLDIGQASSQEALFTLDEVAASGMDYLALGHWHCKRECSAGATICWYPGSPEMISLAEEERGSVLIVECRDGVRPKVAARPVGKRSLLKMNVGVKNLEAGIQQARSHADADRILELKITGMAEPGVVPDPVEIRKRLEDDFFFVQVRNAVLTEMEPEDLAKYSDKTVIGRFIRLAEERKQKADRTEAVRLDEAMQLGLALLSGREVSLWS